MTSKARRVMTAMFEAFLGDPASCRRSTARPPRGWRRIRGPPGRARAVADYIAGMTDRYAILEHRRLFDPSERT